MITKKKIRVLVSLFFCVSIYGHDDEELSARNSVDDSSTYDYVIVGGGTAGGVVANLLSADNKTSVFVIEAGSNLTAVPLFKYSDNAAFSALSFPLRPPFYQVGESIPQTNLDDRQLLWANAKLLGGASELNAQYYARGTNEFFTAWQEIAGDRWSPQEIIDTYKFLEHYRGKTTDPEARGYHGCLDVRQAPQCIGKSTEKITQAIVDATGLIPLVDYNDPQSFVGPSLTVQYTQQGKTGTLRESSATAFLGKHVMTPEGFGVDGRKLRVVFQARALHALWKGKKAVGVKYLYNGKNEKVYARKGVILCAGLQSSPFLMHSGVGPAPLLTSLNIKVKVDNAQVGQSLADQPGIIIVFTTNPLDFESQQSDPNALLTQTAFLPDPTAQPNERAFNLTSITPFPGTGASIVQFIKIKSRGVITIASSDPLQEPVVDFRYLSDPEDLALIQNVFKISIKNIFNALSAMDPAYQLVIPDPAILSDDVALSNFIKENLVPTLSFSGSCRMAPRNQGGVVDSRGRVHGTENLYVADDSIASVPTDGVTAALAYMIGAHVARLIIRHACI